MLRLPSLRRFTRGLSRIRRKIETEACELQMDRLRIALASRGYSGWQYLYGNPAAYDYAGRRDNRPYAATLVFDTTGEGDRFLFETAEAHRHLQGPGTAGIVVTVTGGRRGSGVTIGFNPLLSGVLARQLERTPSEAANAVTQENA